MSTLAQTTEALPTGTWRVDPVHSQVSFAVDYLGGTFRGSFSPVEALLEVDDAGRARLVGSARVENVKVQDENLTAHLLTPDFFDAERTPEIGFASGDLRRTGSELGAAGELTIRGITAPIELSGTIGEPVVDAYGRERFTLTLAGTIDRTQFGLDWNIPLPSGEPSLANDVTVVADLYFVKGA